MQLVIMNIIIGIVVFIGFFIFYGRASGWFVEGGLVYEWLHKKRNKKTSKNSTKKK